MIHALLHDKLAAHMTRDPFDVEDILTSVVLGACRYTDPELALVPFLREAVDLGGRRLALDGVTSAAFEFWPGWAPLHADGALVAGGSQPEVVITLEHADGRRTVVLLEAKLHWVKGVGRPVADEVTDQLGKYWLQLRGRARAGAALAVLFVTTDLLIPRRDLEGTQADLVRKGHPRAPLYWVSWRKFERVTEGVAHPLVADVRLLLRERWELVDARMGAWPSSPRRAPSFTFDAGVRWPRPARPGPRWRFGPSWPVSSPLPNIWSFNDPR